MLKQSFKIDKNLYCDDIVQDAVDFYKQYAPIEFQEGNILVLGDSPEWIDEIFWEFMNYVLALYNETI